MGGWWALAEDLLLWPWVGLGAPGDLLIPCPLRGEPWCWANRAQTQKRQMAPACHDLTSVPSLCLQGSGCLGADTLLAMLKNYCRSQVGGATGRDRLQQA